MNTEVLKLTNAWAVAQWDERNDVLIIEKDQKETTFSEEVPDGIFMVEALDIEYVAGLGVKACIIGTGYALEHPDLPNNDDYKNTNLVTGFNPYSTG
eukprot:14757769-Ditylum_brightwellii.AAC.1